MLQLDVCNERVSCSCFQVTALCPMLSETGQLQQKYAIDIPNRKKGVTKAPRSNVAA